MVETPCLWSKIWLGKLTHLLSALPVRVHLAAGDNGVPRDQDGHDAGQRGLHGDEHDAGDGLGRLGDAELLDEEQDAGDGQDAHDLDDDVDDVPRPALVGSAPQQQDEHDGLDGQLPDGLGLAVAVAGGDDGAAGEHVDDGGDEQPPVLLAVGLVEERVLDPDGLVLVQAAGVALGLLQAAHGAPDAPREVGQDAGEGGERDGGQGDGGPGVAARELEDAVEHPDAVQQQDQRGDGAADGAPVVLAEARQRLREAAEQRPALQDDLDEQDADGDGRDDDGDDEEDRHEDVGLGHAELLGVRLDADDVLLELGPRRAAAASPRPRVRRVDRRLDPAREQHGEAVKRALGLHEAAAGRGGRPVGEHQGGVLQERDAVVGEVATGAGAEAVDGGLQAGPGDQAGGEGEVLGEAAVDGRVVDGQHAVHGHALKPAEDLAEAGAEGARAAGAAQAGAPASQGGRGAGEDQGGGGDAGGDVGHGGDAGGLAVGDLGADAGDVAVAVEALELEGGLGGDVGDVEGDGGHQAGVLGGDGLGAAGGEVALGHGAQLGDEGVGRARVEGVGVDLLAVGGDGEEGRDLLLLSAGARDVEDDRLVAVVVADVHPVHLDGGTRAAAGEAVRLKDLIAQSSPGHHDGGKHQTLDTPSPSLRSHGRDFE